MSSEGAKRSAFVLEVSVEPDGLKSFSVKGSKLMDGMERVWAFPSAEIPPETEQNSTFLSPLYAF